MHAWMEKLSIKKKKIKYKWSQQLIESIRLENYDFIVYRENV